MMHYGYELVKEIGADAVIYASLDEISFIFPSPDKLIHYIKDDSRSCIGALFVQKFVEKFWKYKKAYFKSTVFNIDSENIGRWIEFRKAVGDNTGLMYVAKDLIGLYYETDIALTMLVIAYLLLLLPISLLFSWIERRLRHAGFGNPSTLSGK